MSANPGDGPAGGDLAAEMGRLFRTAAQWWATQRPEPHPGTAAAPECRYCPWCQAVAAVRQHHPDLVDSLAEVIADAGAAIRAAVATAAAPPESGGADEADPRPDDPAEGDRPSGNRPSGDGAHGDGVQPITLE